jgi:hypothetical protein
MANCQFIKGQYDSLVRRRDHVEEELQNSEDPSERSNLIFELKSLNHEIAIKQAQYNACLHPPPPKPDLVAKTFQVKPNHAARTMDISCVIQNDGDGPARGPFEITFGVSYTDQTMKKITRQLNIHIPNEVRIEGHGTQYTSEPIRNLPLVYRDEDPAFFYDLEMIVDSLNQVSELTESNNYFGFRYWAVRPPAP